MNSTVLTTIGSLVGMIPSGLVALTSVVFCLSVIRLARHHTLAQDMYCVETLARVDVLCLDKTGTITEGSMEIHGINTVDLSEDEFCRHLKNLSDAVKDENATAAAVKNYVGQYEAAGEVSVVVPFSSDRKWSGAVIDGRSYVLGAPEFVFPNTAEEIKAITREKAEEGLRVLVLASSDVGIIGHSLPDGLKAEGFIFIADKIRKEAPDTLQYFRDQGVTVKIISGDNPVTVRAVAKRAGLSDCDSIIDMSTLKTDEEVIDAAEKYTIFGRVLPDQKLLLVKALKANGHTVAMTGDGVNDVLALKESDCSIAMASGSDAAKNVSSLVLLDSNFASMPKVVAEGRRSINNLERSASLFLVKTGYNLLIALLFLIVPSILPFEPRHLTLLGGVTIGIPSGILALEPNKNRVEGRFLPKVIMNAVPGIVTVMAGIIAIVITTQTILTGLSPDEQHALYFLATVFAGYLFVFKSCWPFNLLHAVLFVGVIALLVLCYFVQLSFIDIQSFFGLYRGITPAMWKVLAVVWSILVVVFAAMWALDKKYNVRFQTTVGDIEDKIDLRHEEVLKKEKRKRQKEKPKNPFKKDKTKPAICGFFKCVFQKNECKTSITMPRIKSTTPTVILSVLGFTLFAISAASCAVTSVLNMQVIIAVVSGKPPIPKCDTAPTSAVNVMINTLVPTAFLSGNPINDVSTRSIIMPPPAPTNPQIIPIIADSANVCTASHHLFLYKRSFKGSLPLTGTSMNLSPSSDVAKMEKLPIR